MGSAAASGAIEPSLRRFAERLRDFIGAERVLLFGSRATGAARPDSDYDLIIVAKSFGSKPVARRGTGLRDVYYEIGGRAPLDLICLTPEEFGRAAAHITFVNAVLPDAVDLLPVSAQPGG
jgi:predicted nucleotidyltransferase